MTAFDTERPHGGADADGVARWDFSTNSNACGPCPTSWHAVQQADAAHYPDPQYCALKAALARFHGVAADRIGLAASASEAIHRISAWVARGGGRSVHQPLHAFGEYAHAARVWGLRPAECAEAADLVWVCDPSSPLGQPDDTWARAPRRSGAVVVVDRAYAPLRFDGGPAMGRGEDGHDTVWQLWSPNKALGLTGVRGAYLIAPVGAKGAVAQLDALAPSWVLGAHGVAMLQSWTTPVTQQWVAESVQLLRHWTQRQRTLLQALGWQVRDSVTPYGCARPTLAVDAARLAAHLRQRGIKWRDAGSFGLSGWWRLRTMSPEGQDALAQAWREWLDSTVAEDIST